MGNLHRFTRAEFEEALPKGIKDGQPLWKYAGVDRGEHTYTMDVFLGEAKTSKRIMIRSSVHDDVAAGVGDDSIRMWVEYRYKGTWFALTNERKEIGGWTQRTDGWQDRMLSKLRHLYAVARQDELDWYLRSKVPLPKGVQTSRQPVKVERRPAAVQRTPVRVTRQFVDGVAAVAPVAVKPHKFEPSQYQLAIWDAIQCESANLVVEALAGCGKTTTIIRALKVIPQWMSAAFVAFNKRIAKTLRGRAPQGIYVNTLHAMGLGNLCRAFSINDIDGYLNPDKLLDIVKGMVQDIRESVGDEAADLVHTQRFTIKKLVGLLKATLRQPTMDDILYLSDRYGVELNGDPELLHVHVAYVFRRSVEMIETVIDYDDMIYACAMGIVPCRQFDILLVDEAQDLNAAQIEFVLSCSKRIVAVGDRWQSIYGFRGADTRAIDNLIEALDAQVLPLNISYRLTRSHVRYIRERLPHIPLEPASWAEEGVMGWVTQDQMARNAKPGDLVLCRCNAPLVDPAFAAIRAGHKAVILGRDIGEGLIQLLRKVQKTSGASALLELLGALAEYVGAECAKLIESKRSNAAQNLRDRHETIIALSDGCDTLRQIEHKIKTIFSDEEEGIVFSSVHKAKGCEAETVYILKVDLMPHPNATQEWEMEQEWNIWYVAHSRSLHAMYWVS